MALYDHDNSAPIGTKGEESDLLHFTFFANLMPNFENLMP